MLSCQSIGAMQQWLNMSAAKGNVLYVNWGLMTYIWWPETVWTMSPNASKGSGFLTSLFPVPLCNEFLVVWAWLREKGKERGDFTHRGRTDVALRGACSHMHAHSYTHACTRASTECLHFKQMGLHQCTSVMVPGCPSSPNHFQRET